MHEANVDLHQHPTPPPQSPRVRTGGKCKCAYSQQEMGTPQQASSMRGVPSLLMVFVLRRLTPFCGSGERTQGSIHVKHMFFTTEPHS